MSDEIKQTDLDKLMSLNARLGSDTDLVNRINLISKTIREMVRAERCTLFVYDKNTHSFWTAYADGISYIEIPEGEGIVSEVCRSKKTAIENDVEQRTMFDDKIDQSSGFQTKSMIAMPVIGFGGECIGVVQLLNKYDDEPFSENDAKILQFVISHFAAYVQSMTQEQI
jgi:GAF domain-containing protein